MFACRDGEAPLGPNCGHKQIRPGKGLCSRIIYDALMLWRATLRGRGVGL